MNGINLQRLEQEACKRRTLNLHTGRDRVDTAEPVPPSYDFEAKFASLRQSNQYHFKNICLDGRNFSFDLQIKGGPRMNFFAIAPRCEKFFVPLKAKDFKDVKLQLYGDDNKTLMGSSVTYALDPKQHPNIIKIFAKAFKLRPDGGDLRVVEQPVNPTRPGKALREPRERLREMSLATLV